MTPNDDSATYDRTTCDVDGCDQRYFCGVGMPPLGVCFEHFEAYLRGAREVIDKVRELAR